MQIAPTETFTLVASFQMVGHALRGVLIAERFSQGISRTGVLLTEMYTVEEPTTGKVTC